MTTLYTHAVAGLGIARLYTARPLRWPYWTLALLLPIVPDLDVFSYQAYGSALGHRGITHCLLFALAVGLLAASLTSRYLHMRWWSLAFVYFLVVASHGVLDAMTRGGENIPFFWPSAVRYGNWGPIPVSDIAFDWPDPRTSRAVRAELLWIWLPTALLVGAVSVYRRRRRPRSARDSAA